MLKAISSNLDTRTLLYKLATGKVKESPFPAGLIKTLQDILAKELYPGQESSKHMQVHAGQPFRLQAISDWLKAQEDPDWGIFGPAGESFQTGIRNGANSTLPRVPSVFEKRVKFKKYDLGDYDPWRKASRSVEENLVQFRQQMQEETDLGRMQAWGVDAAKAEWGPTLRFATVMALNKEDGSLRIIHDGTPGVH